MKRAVPIIVMTIIVAGCTALPSQGGDEQQPGGLHVTELRLADATVQRGETTTLRLRVENTNPLPVEEFSAELLNAGDITVSRSIPAGRGTDCTTDTIPAADVSPGTFTCVWQLDTSPLDGNTTGTYPLSVRLRYNASLRMRSTSLQFDVVSDVEQRQRVTRETGNGEIALTASYRPEIASGTQEVDVALTVENVGGGTVIVKGSDDHAVTLEPSGSFVGPFTMKREAPCTTFNFVRGQTTVSRTCVFERSSQISAGTTYSLRFTADYRYQRYRDIPLTVTD